MRRWGAVVVLILGCAQAPSTPAPSVPGNSCESAIELAWADSGPLVFTTEVPPADFGNHAQCSRVMTGPDVIHRITPPGAGVLVARADGGHLTLGSAACEYECSYVPIDRPAWLDAVSFIKRIDANAFSLIVEPTGTEPALTTLRLEPPVSGDRCEEPIEVVLDGGTWDFTGDLRFAFNELVRNEAGDVFFHLPVPAASVVRVQSDAILHSWNVCGGRTAQLGTSAALEATPGDLWLSMSVPGAPVDAPRVQHLTVTLAPPPPGDQCAQPAPLTFVTDAGVDLAHVTGDLALAGSGLASFCLPATPDVFFQVHVDRSRDFSARLTTATADAVPVLELNDSCVLNTPLTICSKATLPGSGTTLSITAMPPGDYLLRVSRAGAFTLDVTLGP
jgi:hypothetical protein